MSLVTVPGLGEESEPIPASSDAENHTIPHRDTVAKVAYCRLSTCSSRGTIESSQVVHTGLEYRAKVAHHRLSTCTSRRTIESNLCHREDG